MAKRDRATGGEAIGDFSDPVLISTLTGWLEASGARELEITTADGRALKIVLAAGRPVAKLPEVVPVQPVGGPEAHAFLYHGFLANRADHDDLRGKSLILHQHLQNVSPDHIREYVVERDQVRF